MADDDDELYFNPNIPDSDLELFKKFPNHSIIKLKEWDCVYIPEDMWSDYIEKGRLPNYIGLLPITKKKARAMGVIP